MKPTIKGRVVCEYLERFPNVPTKSLARKIWNENKEVYKDMEDVRGTIRYYRGAHGKKDNFRKNPKYFRITETHNPFDLPDPEPIPETEDYIFPYKKYDNLLIMSDLQIPYQDNDAIKLAMEYGIAQKVNGVMLLGDVVDFFALSFYERDPRKRNFQDEVSKIVQFLSALRKTFPQAAIFFKLGNHEHRLRRYLSLKAPELFDVEVLQFEQLLELDRLNISLIDWMQIIRLGQLSAVHGQEFGRAVYSPVNPARGAFIRGYASCIVGHWHQSSEHTSTTMEGKLITTWSLGCLCNLKPEFRPINNWGHGFAHIQMEPNGDFHVHNKRIYKGKVL